MWNDLNERPGSHKANVLSGLSYHVGGQRALKTDRKWREERGVSLLLLEVLPSFSSLRRFKVSNEELWNSPFRIWLKESAKESQYALLTLAHIWFYLCDLCQGKQICSWMPVQSGNFSRAQQGSDSVCSSKVHSSEFRSDFFSGLQDSSTCSVFWGQSHHTEGRANALSIVL